MLVQPELPRRAGNDGEVVAFLDTMLPEQRQNTLQNLAAARPAEFFLEGEQPNFTNGPAPRQVDVEVGQFLVEGKRPVAAHGEHADQFLILQTNQVRVFRVKFIHEPLRGRGLMLRDFLDEGFVIEPVNLLEFPIFGRGLERQRVLCTHNQGGSGLVAAAARGQLDKFFG